jgi:hypothetical protein
MPQPIWLEPWHRLSRAVPTFETVAHQASGPEWEETTRTVQITPVKGSPNRWSVALFSGTKRVRDWLLPDVVDAPEAQKAATRLLLNWGIRDEDVNPEVGQVSTVSLEQPGGFEWKRLRQTVVGMYQDRQTLIDSIMVLNRLYPGRGTELGRAMLLVQKATEKDLASLMKIVDLRAAVLGGNESLRPELEKLQMVNEARKEAHEKSLKGVAYQAEITRLATQPSEVVEQSPYQMLTGAGGGFTVPPYVLSLPSGDSGSGSKGGSGGGRLPSTPLTDEQRAAIEAQSREYYREEQAKRDRVTAQRLEQERQDKEAQQRQREALSQTVPGQEEAVLKKVIETSKLPLWTALKIKKDGFMRLVLVVSKRGASMDDSKRQYVDGDLVVTPGSKFIEGKDLWNMAKLVAKKYKDVRKYDVAVEWDE